MYKILDGKKLSEEIRQKVKKEVDDLKEKPCLAVILVGDDPASKVYVNIKEKACKEVGIVSRKYELGSDASEKDVLDLIGKLNKDKKVTGILVQMPVPPGISRNSIMLAVLPEKDVDGFHPQNYGKMVLGEDALMACTPLGVMRLLEKYRIGLKGKDAVVIGSSAIVGKPMAAMLLNACATVTVCHIDTKDLAMHTRNADMIISAVGKRNLVTEGMVKEGAVVVDVGMVKEGKDLYGDVDFDKVKAKCSYITPVPGGVGPMTVACLLENTLFAYKIQKEGGFR